VNKLSQKVDDSKNAALEKVESLFARKFVAIGGAVVACISIMFGIVMFVEPQGVTRTPRGWVGILGGLGVAAVVWLLSRRSEKQTALTK
jgi:hypothetical protein